MKLFRRSLAEHMLTLLRDPALSVGIIQNARQRVLTHSWGPVYSRLRRLYHGDPLP